MMADMAKARSAMVNSQIRPNRVTDRRLLSAMASVERERFLPPSKSVFAYIDEDIQLTRPDDAGHGRYLMEPMVFAQMVQVANVGPDDVVLDVACGTGYSSAILARLASSVVALEDDKPLADTATQTLEELDVDNAAVVTGVLAEGYAPEAPYDVIILNGAVERIPDALCLQLKEGGRIVGVLGSGLAGQINVWTRRGAKLTRRSVFNAAIKPLPGFSKAVGFEF